MVGEKGDGLVDRVVDSMAFCWGNQKVALMGEVKVLQKDRMLVDLKVHVLAVLRAGC